MPNFALRQYSETHFDKNLGDVSGRRFINALLSRCKFTKVKDAQFLHCVMEGSEIACTDLHDLLGASITLSCFSFEGLKLSPETLDAILFLLTISDGNEETRERIRQIIDPQRLRLLERAFPQIE